MVIHAKDKAQCAYGGAFGALAGTITEAVSEEAAFVFAADHIQRTPRRRFGPLDVNLGRQK
jgi:hypothetical protein